MKIHHAFTELSGSKLGTRDENRASKELRSAVAHGGRGLEDVEGGCEGSAGPGELRGSVDV
jgi:hypothetical protein